MEIRTFVGAAFTGRLRVTTSGDSTVTSPGPPRRRDRQRGFTFIEILVVLAVIAMVAVISVVNLRTIQQRLTLESEVHTLTAFLEDVPKYARATNGPVYLVWNGGSRSFAISTDSAGTNVLEKTSIEKELMIDPPTEQVLRCDVYGRVFPGTSITMVTAPQTMSLVHRDAQEKPAPSYVLSLSPLWAVDVIKE